MQSHWWTAFNLKAPSRGQQNTHLPSVKNGKMETQSCSWWCKFNQLFKGTARTRIWLFDPCSYQQTLWATVTSVAQPLDLTETHSVHSQYRKSWRAAVIQLCASRQGSVPRDDASVTSSWKMGPFDKSGSILQLPCSGWGPLACFQMQWEERAYTTQWESVNAASRRSSLGSDVYTESIWPVAERTDLELSFLQTYPEW